MGVCKLQLGAIPMPHTLSGSMTSCEDQGSAASGLILFGAEHGKFYAQGVKKKKKNNKSDPGKQSGKDNIAGILKSLLIKASNKLAGQPEN